MNTITDLKEINREGLSPKMLGYLTLKDNYPHSIVFIRLGDFYECFCADALTVAKEINLVLTHKVLGGMQKVSMTGFPYHSLNRYIEQLYAKGYSTIVVTPEIDFNSF
jgi:DNA mismatch repair protein MutS